MIVLLLWLQNRRLKKANERFRESQAHKAKDYMVTSTTSTNSARASTFMSEPIVKKVVNADVASVSVAASPNPAFGKELEAVPVEADSGMPRLRSAFTKVFSASEVPIEKDKGEMEDSSGDSVEMESVAVAVPVPAVAAPAPTAVAIHASNNPKGFEEAPAAVTTAPVIEI